MNSQSCLRFILRNTISQVNDVMNLKELMLGNSIKFKTIKSKKKLEKDSKKAELLCYFSTYWIHVKS